MTFAAEHTAVDSTLDLMRQVLKEACEDEPETYAKVKQETIKQAEQLVHDLAAEWTKVHDIYVSENGGIVFLWRANGCRLEAKQMPSGKLHVSLAGKTCDVAEGKAALRCYLASF